jgi:hypothetical protein
MTRLLIIATCIMLLGTTTGLCEDKVFSGPQVGEKLKAFKVKGVFDDDAGKDLDFVTKADGKPILLVFVHDANRPSIGMTRVLMTYAMTRSKDLVSGTVWLTDDATEAEGRLKTMRHALAKDAPIGISPDGKEGPGAYGLNRNMTLTIIVAKDNKVTANFALVQPSLQADLPKVLKAVVAAAGGEMPKYEEWAEFKAMTAKRPGANDDPKIPMLMRALIQLKNTDAEVEKIAAEIEKYAQENAAAKKEFGRIANAVANGGKLENYGTAKCQEYLKKWAKEFGGEAPKERPKKDGDKR